MRKIVFIHLLNDFSGSPKVLSQVIKTAQNKNINIELFTGKDSVGFLSNITENHNFYYYKRYNNRILTLFSYMFSQIEIFLKLMKFRNSLNTLIYVNTMLPFGAAIAGKLMGKPVLYHIHETYIQPAILKKFLRFVVQQTSSKVIFVSHSLKVAESFKVAEQAVIHNALPQEYAKNGLEKHQKIQQSSKDDFKVMMICSLKSYKGIGQFVEIGSLCELDQKISFTLILNSEQNEIHNYFRNTNLPTNVTIVATQKDLHNYYQNADLVLNLSLVDKCVETFGLTLIEAMSYGIPVIAPPVGGPTEIVTDGREGYLISSYETEKIANQIRELSKNFARYKMLSENAYKRSLDFNEETFHKKIMSVVDE